MVVLLFFVVLTFWGTRPGYGNMGATYLLLPYSFLIIWLWVKTVLGYHFGVGAPPMFSVQFVHSKGTRHTSSPSPHV